jgi:hypothetical protein
MLDALATDGLVTAVRSTSVLRGDPVREES